MRQPNTASAWMEWDDACAAEDIRRRASSARTTDEYLEVLREAGSLAAGAQILNHGCPAQLTLTDRIVLSQCHLRESERLAAQATAPVSDQVRAAGERHYRIVRARLAAFRVLGDGPALSEEWRLARGAFGGITHDYEAAVRAELAARSLRETA